MCHEWTCKSLFLLSVAIVEAQSTELTVSERNTSFELELIANTTSEFDYNITMDTTDISTGEFIVYILCMHYCTIHTHRNKHTSSKELETPC